MARFYGTLRGRAQNQVTRCGDRGGLTAHAAGWSGAIRVSVFERDGEDRFVVELVPWMNSGGASRVLAEGPLDSRRES